VDENEMDAPTDSIEERHAEMKKSSEKNRIPINRWRERKGDAGEKITLL